MKISVRIFAWVVLLVMAGCVPSVHPIYSQQDLIFEESLVNRWSKQNSLESWNFAQKNGSTYQLTYTDTNGKEGRFEAHLVKLNKVMLLDIYPEEVEFSANSFYKIHLAPCHTFMVIDSIKPSLTMRTLNAKWLDGLLKNNPQALKHERHKRGVIVTASTKNYQEFILKHLDTKKAFTDPVVLVSEKNRK